MRKPIGNEVKWAECSLIIGMGCWVQFFSLILDSSGGLWVGIQSAGELVFLRWAEDDNLFPFDSKIYCLCQSIEINNNKHVYRQSQVLRKSIGSEVNWAKCSLIIGTGCWVQVFSLILDSSVWLWVGIQSAGELVSETSKLRIRPCKKKPGAVSASG